MENLVLSFNVMLPILILLLFGYGLKYFKVVDSSSMKSINSINFKIFLPILLFNNIYNTDLDYAFNPKLLVFTGVSVISVFTILFILVPFFEKDDKKRGVLIQGIGRTNFVIFGIPIASALFGETAVGCASMLVAIVVPLVNVFSVIALEVYRGTKLNFKKL